MVALNAFITSLMAIACMAANINAQNLNFIYNGPPLDSQIEMSAKNLTQLLNNTKNATIIMVPTSIIPLQSSLAVETNGSTPTPQQQTTSAPPTRPPLGQGVVITDRLGQPITSQQRDIFTRISSGSQSFALELFSKFSDHITPTGRDFMISPFSIWALLLLIAEGAVGNSLTQLQNTLRITDDTYILRQAYKVIQNTLKVNTSTIEVSVLQALFTDINRPVDRNFEDVMERSYEANLVAVDFHVPANAAASINDEVRRATHNLIKYAVTPGDLTDAQLVLLSTLYFKGQWKLPFNRSLTERQPFHSEDGKEIGEVDMMFQMANFNYTAMADLEGHVLELPYGKENRLSMLLILPRRGIPLTKITKNLQSIGIARIFEKLHSSSAGFEDEQVEVHLPRFSASSSFIVNGILHEMGIQDIFDPSYANLTNISPSVFVSKLFHNTKIIVDEEGTVAAAATTASFANKSQPPKFNFDRPFIYMITEKITNSLLFCGQVMNPIFER